MSDGKPKGIPFTQALSDSIDDWSGEVFEALCDWPVAKEGAWTRWDPGYLLLEIDRVDNAPVERIILYTADEELTVEFGYWETHLPEPLGTGEEDAVETAKQAKRLIEDWLSGRIRTAVYTNDAGKWCGSKLIDGDDLAPQLSTEWLTDFGPTRIEVRTPRRASWRRFLIDGVEIAEVT